MKRSPFETIARVAQRTTSQVVARVGAKSAPLREYLATAMAGVGKPASFVKEPLIEAAHGFVSADDRLSDLSGSLLRADVVDALDGGEATDKWDRERYRFRREWRPFRHQLAAWRELTAPTPKSVLVTSGTGSGKTECFLVPLLDSLARQAADGADLVGVQAIMLYPLNALINSQRERLSDWTAPFNGKIRFALYNGATPDEVKKAEQAKHPEEVMDRKGLRSSPPPILVTNITMLEYMLIRFEDSAILKASRGKLRYVILDEAHSYVGSQAAELSLLLRRVLFAFGVEAKNVRFVATSATIGKQGDPDTRAGLRRFLAQVAGIPETNVVVIEGERKVPTLPVVKPGQTLPGIDEIAGLDPTALFDRLGSTPAYANAHRKLSQQPLTFNEWCEAVGKDADTGLAILEAGARAERDGERLLPLRVHAFHRSQGGAWACLNPQCPGRAGSSLESPEWGFGAVEVERTELCPHCSSPMLEIKFCTHCEQISLAGQKHSDQVGRQWLLQSLKSDDDDEFFSELEVVEDDEGDADGVTPDAAEQGQTFALRSREVLVASVDASFGSRQHVDASSGQILDLAREDAAEFLLGNPLSCPHCSATFSLRAAGLASIRLGGPFLLGSIVPELLDDALEAPLPIEGGKKDAGIRPADGRQLLMFTDSRQGTARLAAKLQRDAELNHVRAFIYHTLQSKGGKGDPAAAARLEGEIRVLRDAEAALPAEDMKINVRQIRVQKEADLVKLNQPQPVTWGAMVGALANDERINRFILDKVWVEREPTFKDAEKFAQFLLFREFLRQPPRANSAETMGLASLRFAAFDDIRDDEAPSRFIDRGGKADDWRDFLYMAAHKIARQNWCAAVDPTTFHWISHKRGALKIIRPPGLDYERNRHVPWPSQCKPIDRRQLVNLLAQGLGLSLNDAQDRDDIDECLSRAWLPFQRVCQSVEGGFTLDFKKASIAPVFEAFACPASAGLFRDRTFKGLSPVAPRVMGTAQNVFLRADKVKLPQLPFPYHEAAGIPVDSATVSGWLDRDAEVQNLRRMGLWSDLHDRIAQYSVYFRAAEHSAQQSSHRLKEYEREFKAGRINVLSCSTTMEMGVDIGSISTVVMSNVPPSIASYRQRVGRAGRRGQAMAVSLTLCKDRPIDRSVYRDPMSFLERTIYAPAVALDSPVIAQRHVNATLLSKFLADNGAELHRMSSGPFFGFKLDGAFERSEAPAEKFASWLDTDSLREDATIRAHLIGLLAGTALDGGHLSAIDETRESITRVREAFGREWEAIKFDLDATTEAGGRRTALEMQMRKHLGEFLLGVLSQRGFLPGYGFPTDVVSFDNTVFEDKGETANSTARNAERDMPNRQLDLAIRDYAPGSDVVVDGRVYRSAGVRLSWKRPVTEESADNIQALGSAWRCRNCGAIGAGHATPIVCSSCGRGNIDTHRYLKPSGFSCDPMVKPHDKVEEVNYVRPKAPWVATQGGEWVHLTSRTAGRHRASRSGTVFHYTLGANGNGYAICLSCGRSEPEHASEADNPPVPLDMQGHRPLRTRKKGGGRCESIDTDQRPFAIQRHRALGYEITTDVFELQLTDLESASVALPLAAAFRDALARKLGVEDDEMGISVAHTLGEDDIGSWSIFVYDKSPGGAGFAVAAGAHVEDLLRDSVSILDCPNKSSCVSGCPECVMCRDIESHEGRIDRHAALAFARKLVGSLGVPPELAIFGKDTRPETQPIADALIREMERRQDDELLVWLGGSTIEWSLGRWAALRVAQRLAARQRTVRIILEGAVLKALDAAAKIEIYGLVVKSGCQLYVGQPQYCGSSHRLLAWVGKEAKGQGWVSNDVSASVANEKWGSSDVGILLRGPVELSSPLEKADFGEFLAKNQNLAFIEVTSQFDGPIDKFGAKFWQMLGENSAAIARRVENKTPLLSVEYSDRYLNSPLPVRLLMELLKAAPNISAATTTKVTTATLAPSNFMTSPAMFKHDWRVGAHRETVIVDALSKAITSSFTLAAIDKRQMAHGRILRLRFADGVVEIHLDQGLGYWTTANPLTFNFSSNAPDQVFEIRRAVFRVRGVGGFPTSIVVNEKH